MQLLSITTDNASNNDTMVNGISEQIECFPGEAGHTRCLDHICHLGAKSLLRPFDITTGREAKNARDAAEASLEELARGLDLEEMQMVALGLDSEDPIEELEKEEKRMKGNAAEDEEEEDNEEIVEDVEGHFDEMVGMSKEERAELDDVVRPVKLVLVKASSHTFTER